MRAVACEVSPLFELALILAHETGHRIGAIRLTRWSHVDLKGGTVLWPAANDKIGFEHTAPLSEASITDVCGLGGWKDKQTMLRCYQQPDQATMREALDQRRRLRASSSG